MTLLREAPVIAHRFLPVLPWLTSAASRSRDDYAATPGTDQEQFDLRRLAEDVWGIDGRLAEHTDQTRDGFRVIGLVLVNDCRAALTQGGVVYDLPVGTVYHIDGRAPHGTLLWGHPGKPAPADEGLFTFMAWDVHRNEDLWELVNSIPDAMRAYGAGEARVDVSTVQHHVDELDRLG